MKNPILSDLKVLVVDPNENMRRLLKQIIHGFGCKAIREAGDGSRARDIMQSFAADLVITEWVMKPMGGAEFLGYLRSSKDAASRQTPVIVLTGHAEPEMIAAARDAGITEFLAKPVAPTTLLNRMVAILKRPREFVETGSYVGPDRRRRHASEYAGEKRRKDEDLPIATD